MASPVSPLRIVTRTVAAAPATSAKPKFDRNPCAEELESSWMTVALPVARADGLARPEPGDREAERAAELLDGRAGRDAPGARRRSGGSAGPPPKGRRGRTSLAQDVGAPRGSRPGARVYTRGPARASPFRTRGISDTVTWAGAEPRFVTWRSVRKKSPLAPVACDACATTMSSAVASRVRGGWNTPSPGHVVDEGGEGDDAAGPARRPCSRSGSWTSRRGPRSPTMSVTSTLPLGGALRVVEPRNAPLPP